MQLTLLIHRGPVVVDGWQRAAANDPLTESTHPQDVSSGDAEIDMSTVREIKPTTPEPKEPKA